jgi:hypothetical protein
MYKPLLIAPECLAVPCIFNSRFPSSFIDKVDFFKLELVLRGFVVCLDMEGTNGDIWGRTTSALYTKKKGVSLVAELGELWLPHSMHESSSTYFLPCFFKPS